MKVVFYTVKTGPAKIHYLLRAISHHFTQKEKIQIIVPDKRALTFIDDLLWSQPKESFLPHCTSSPVPFHDLIFICLPEETVDDFPFVFNLCPTAYKPHPRVKTLYEFEDASHPEKKALFQVKFKYYQSLGHTLSGGSTLSF
ncbi:MAG: DNA polymerase III subunit chi [Verrucomicrobia bacterium]|nr:DNA polymerase III subunit chi [Verrucomicrobiota bacterium]